MYDVILNNKLPQREYQGLERRELLKKLLGITDYAAQKGIHVYNEHAEGFEKKKKKKTNGSP